MRYCCAKVLMFVQPAKDLTLKTCTEVASIERRAISLSAN